MDKGARELLRQSPEGAPRPDFVSGETFVFAHQPTHQIGVHMLPDRRHRRPVKAAVILLPAREDRIEHGRKIGQFFVALQLQMPSPNGLSHGLAGRAADRRGEVHVDPAIYLATAFVDKPLMWCYKNEVTLFVAQEGEEFLE